MVFNNHASVAAIAMEDDLGITYLVENAPQFWSELEDILNFGIKDVQTLSLLDSTLRRSLGLCSAYHEQYLQSPLQLQHACELILDSELFEFHSERMSDILVHDVKSRTDPHSQFITYHVLFCYGRRRNDFFRSHKRWQPLLPLLMDHILVEIDPDIEDTYFGIAAGSNGSFMNVPVPIEAKLRSLGMKLLYEVCCVQKLSMYDLRIFDGAFIDYLFDLVEQTRHMHDEALNYSVIKLIVSLNEQFMVALLTPDGESVKPNSTGVEGPESNNRVLRVLMRRLGSSKTFGENMIFMLNRAGHSPEDSCLQLLILKTLYILFTTKGTSEYFYTNDLTVLVDVFLRELVDLDEDSESLRHTYLRVLHPLLTKTQLRDVPYKRSQVIYALESLVANSRVRDVNPTTKRLVERCLSGDWCINLRRPRQGSNDVLLETSTNDILALQSPTLLDHVPAAAQLERSSSKKLKSSKSVEHLKAKRKPPKLPHSALITSRPNNASATSLPSVTTVTAPDSRSVLPVLKNKVITHSVQMGGQFSNRNPPPRNIALELHNHHHPLVSLSSSLPDVENQLLSPRRSAPPPPPPKRRKPPAIPIERSLRGATLAVIQSPLAASPLRAVGPNLQLPTPL